MKIAGYEIVRSEKYYMEKDKEFSIVIGFNPNAVQPFVTWECTNDSDYYWGHYFHEANDALTDFHARLLNKYENLK